MGSNRTFMELKYGHCCVVIMTKCCSNRTFMELKLTQMQKVQKQTLF